LFFFLFFPFILLLLILFLNNSDLIPQADHSMGNAGVVDCMSGAKEGTRRPFGSQAGQ
jgi:hypothetical protein